ncbi:multicopper oxidase [Comamonas thiooxydans]|uniref:Multicopper oxidase CueO n=2 Tax=Burkholderiales TaxID=80840 RepID=A0A0E3BSU5_9BURK|nr:MULTISPECIES: multicopper oxidase domain-containing protein [Pseudomonadota]MDN4681596.1 multicopper oxidase domain-containing protein [Pseudomonas aeruginosa]KGH10014.1 multicopper oxidase [Comamonas thiooxydans]KGH15675.1 multicopper oxidase [Comamonas thiooxydans]MCD0497195.1 multicopper oxidase domain-containing protein [Achromobacter sp. MY14]MDP5439793.1 multicopper oxidase domain-containing protein [Pseudomonas aeruginosa]
MTLTRRSFLTGAVLAGGSLWAASSLWRPSFAAEARQLRIPELIDARDQGQSIALTAQVGKTSFFPGRESVTLGFNGSYLGPTLRVHRGDEVEVAVRNALGEDTTVHWHGLLIPGELDGGPHQTIRPGSTWRPVLPIRQPAATLWYHSHMHGRTGEQVYAGLAGLLIVSDDDERALGLPSEYGVDDLPLILQDRQFENGTLILPQGMMSTMHGRRGDTLMVNGTVNPVARVPRGLVRLRLVNGSNAREYDLAFADDRPFHWIASEGGLLEKPVELRSLRLAPGERAEILADFSDGRPATLETGPDGNLSMMMGMMRGAANLLGGNGREAVIQFEPQGKAALDSKVPERLLAHERPDVSKAVRRRRFVMNMGMGNMMRGGMGMLSINGRAFDMGRVDEQIRLGDTEIWEVTGEMMAHPFHIHGVHFEVLSRNGAAPGIRDQGLRDTVVAQEPVELLVKFTQTAVASPFMYHCHILEHEDNGMMGQFVVS